MGLASSLCGEPLNLDSYSRLVGSIYDASIDPLAWPEALHNAEEAFRGRVASLLTRDVETMRGHSISTYDAEAQREYWQHWRAHSPLAPPSTPRPPVETDRDLLPGRGLLRTAFHNEFQRPRDVHTVMMVWLPRQGTVQPTFSVARHPSAGEFDRADIEAALLLRPHLVRALALGQRLGPAAIPAAGAVEALDLLRHGVLILDDEGRVLHVNRAAERLLAEREGLFHCQGRLRAATPSSSRRLDQTLARAAGLTGLPAAAGAMALPRAEHGPPLALLAVPIRRELAWLGANRPAVCLCVTDPAADPGIPAGQLAAIFGLTVAEAQIARALLDGGDVGEIAERLRLSAHTVRTHLARIRQKTTTHRQSELVRQMLRLPPFGA